MKAGFYEKKIVKRIIFTEVFVFNQFPEMFKSPAKKILGYQSTGVAVISSRGNNNGKVH